MKEVVSGEGMDAFRQLLRCFEEELRSSSHKQDSEKARKATEAALAELRAKAMGNRAEEVDGESEDTEFMRDLRRKTLGARFLEVVEAESGACSTTKAHADAAILAAKNGFKDLASKITRRMYLDTRKRTLMRDFFE